MEIYKVTSSDVRNNLLKLGQIVFEVTTTCNFRCEYCIYSGLYEGMQTLSNDYLTFEKAKKILDYLSGIWTTGMRINAKPIYIGFYGGEPLMNFSLVEQIVDYIERNWEWPVTFTMTTNAYLLDKYMEYLQRKDFFLTISLDGDQIGRVNQQVQYYSINLKKHSFGVQNFSFSLGLVFNLCCVFLILPSVTILISVPFGIYCLMSLFSFSTPPFCHEQYESVK